MQNKMFQLVETESRRAVIKVIGVGGGGGNAVQRMLHAKVEGVDYISANTDKQALAECQTRDEYREQTLLPLGESLTKGLGAGGNPEVGRQAAEEDAERIGQAIDGADMLFIAAGMGGGTGTGAAPVVAKLAREKKILSVAVVTKPFPFEQAARMQQAQNGIDELQENVDSLIVIPNEKVLQELGQSTTMREAFAKADEVLMNAVQGISELITLAGYINVDFADVRAVMSEAGMAMMGSAVAGGEKRAEEAARRAASSPFLEDMNLHGAKGLLVNVTSGTDLTLGEYETIGNIMREYAAEDARVIIGNAFDSTMKENLRVTMVATGLQRPQAEAEKPVVTLVSRRKRALPPAEVATVRRRVAGGGGGDFIAYDQPSYMRQGGDSGAVAEGGDGEDLPAFLRAQAD